MLEWLKSFFMKPNIICVRDPLDDGKEDSSYPTQFAEMMGQIRREKDSLDAALAEIRVQWLVAHLGMWPAFCLWDCSLYKWDNDGSEGGIIECCANNTAVGAVRCCLSRLNGGKRLCSYECGK
jgi:hypothetical protein